jgi:WD40 repeat protein
MQSENEWKAQRIRTKGLKRLKKLERLSRLIYSKTAEIIEKVNQLHFEAIEKVNKERILVLEMINSNDDQVYSKFSKKYFCGMMKEKVDFAEISSFYRQEMFCEVKQEKFQFLGVGKKEKKLETRFNLLVEDYEPPVSLLTLSENGEKLALVDGKLFVQVFSLPEKQHLAKLKSPDVLCFLAFDSELTLQGLTKKGLLLTWDLTVKGIVSQMQVSEVDVKCCKMIGKNLFVATFDLKILRINFERLDVEVILQFKSEINFLAGILEPFKLVGAAGGEVVIFDLENREVGCLVSGNSAVTALDCARNHDLVFIAFMNKPVQIWSTGPAKLVASLTGPPDLITYLTLTPDDSQLIACSQDKRLKIFNISSKKQEQTLNPMPQAITSLIQSPDQKYLYISSNDLKVFSFSEKKLIDFQLTRAHSTTVTCILFTSNHSKAITGSKDKTIKIWNLSKNKLKSTLTGHNDEVTDLLLSSSEKILISASNDKTIRSWDLLDNKMIIFSPAGAKSVKLFMDNKAEVLISLTEDRNIRVFSVMTGKMLHMFQAHAILSCGFLVFSNMIIVADEKNLKILNISEKKIEKTLVHEKNLVSIDASQDLIVSLSADGLVNVLTCEGFSVVSSFEVGAAVQVVVSEDSKYLACRYSTHVKLWELKSGIEVDFLPSLNDSNWLKRYPIFNKLDLN